MSTVKDSSFQSFPGPAHGAGGKLKDLQVAMHLNGPMKMWDKIINLDKFSMDFFNLWVQLKEIKKYTWKVIWKMIIQ